MKKIMISAVGSGMGKTVITGGLIRCFMQLGYKVVPYKCGPDYIDPMFHSLIAGVKCRNLDIFLEGEEGVRKSFGKVKGDIKIIEGVMGYHDGIGGSREASSSEIADLLGVPVILVLDPEKTEDPVPELKKLMSAAGDPGICGILFSGCRPENYEGLRARIETEAGIRVYGYLTETERARLESRHLGLVTAQEIQDLQERFDDIAELMSRSVDIKGLLELAESGEDAAASDEMEFGERQERKARCRVAAAGDEAFSFYYEDNLDALKEAGAEIVFFSPMRDELPDADGLYLGGGYPELYLKELSDNTVLLDQIRESVERGMPLVAECGGFLYLQQLMRDGTGAAYPLAGVFKGEGIYGERLNRRFGYIRVFPEEDSLLFRAGEEIHAHEFHYWDCTDDGNALKAVKADGRSWSTGFVSDSMYAGFPHFYFTEEHGMAERFADKAEEYRAKREAESRWMSLAKPLGSLGALEDYIIKIAELTGSADITLNRRSLLVFIGDHGVAEEGVCQSDHSVTLAVAKALGSGCSTVNYPAKAAGCTVIPVDVGMYDDTPEGIRNRKMARGCGNIAKGAAMTKEECRQAMDIGREQVRFLKEKGEDIVLLGEMGIGNTTACAAMSSVLLGEEPSSVTGRGAGLSDEGLEKKIRAVEKAIEVNAPDKDDPVDVLSKLGGFEIAALCGACLAAYEYRMPVILDGLITDVAALAACRMKPAAGNALIASHRSAEPAAGRILDELRLKALISAGIRLGEGAGALMGLSLIDQALTVYNSGHTFSELGISPYVPQK